MAQKKRKNHIKGKTIRKIIILVLVIIVVVLIGMRYLRQKVNEQFATQGQSTVKTAEVTTGSISTTVTGSGTLADEESEEILIPSSVTLNKVYVSKGDSVTEGDLLATIDSASVLASMSDLQDKIDDLDEDLAEAEDDAASGTLAATVSGRVKVIQVEEGDDVASTMYDDGALILMSLDGYLALDVEAESLAVGDEVTVAVGEETYEGKVDSVLNKVATILIADDEAAVGDEAIVSVEGSQVGTGTLYIHESLAVTGYVGTVETIKVKTNDKVKVGDTLMTLADTAYSANYTALLKERASLEEDLQELIVLYKQGAIYATCSGTITGITDNSSSGTSSSTAGSYGMMGSSNSSNSSSSDSVIAICPNNNMVLTISVDESSILSVSKGQAAAISITSISDTTFTGMVTGITTSSTSSSGVTSYSVEITLTKESDMMSGMSATAAITIEGVENAMLLPTAAVTKTRETAYVYTTYDEETDTLGGMTEVTIGISNNSYTEIVSGLKEGQTVYYQETQTGTDFSNFGGMGGFSMGGDFSGMPSGDFSGMPSDGDFSGMPSGNFGGGNMPSGNFGGGSMPSGFGGN